MKQRAHLVGGDIIVNSTQGQGVRVAFSFPTGEPD
jgi:signal transduction histidine kinase